MKAVVTGCDTHPIRSLKLMLESVGYDVYMLSDKALDELAKKGYSGGVRAQMLKEMGYVEAGIPWCDENALNDCDLFVDIKVREADTIMPIYPRLKDKTIIFLINGGRDGYVDYGERYPVVTSNFWVEKNAFKCFMPFDNLHNLEPRAKRENFEPPIGLLHNAKNWGFGRILDQVIKNTGLKVYGSYGSPAGILPNNKVGDELEKSLAFVHLKASDCPGYALYEAFASGVPVVVTDLFVHRMAFQELYKDGATCLMWGQGSFVVENPDEPWVIKEFMDESAEKMIEQITDCVNRLADPDFNYAIGMSGHHRWKKLTEWTPEKIKAFAEFLNKYGFKTF